MKIRKSNNTSKALLCLFICATCMPLLVQGLLRKTQQQMTSTQSQQTVTPTLQHDYPASYKIGLTRDGRIERKIDLFNYFSQQSAVQRKDQSFISLSYDSQTQQTSKQKIENPFTSHRDFYQSFVEKSQSKSKTAMHSNSHPVSLNNHANTFYTGQIRVGTFDSSNADQQAEHYNMIFDTGSTNIFLNSIKCQNIGCKRGNQFDSNDSKTFQEGSMEIEVQFGTGTIIGEDAKDTFNVGGLQVENVQFIEITEEIGSVFDSGQFDGLIGLSFPALSDNTPTVIDAMSEQGLIETKQMSFYMSRQDESNSSFLSFGEIDYSLVEGEIVYHEVKSPQYWTILAQQILVGGKDTMLCSNQNPCPLAIDSGTSIVAGPSSSIENIMSLIESTQTPCSQIQKMPELTFVIDDKHYSLMAEEYMISVLDNSPSVFLHSENSVHCEPLLMQLDIEEEKYGALWVLGDLFMSKYLTVFNRDNQTVGFGKLKSFDQHLYSQRN